VKVRFFLSLYVLSLLLFGCAQTRETAITPIPTSIQIDTVIPILVPSKTATITPTFTLTPQPTPALAFLSVTNVVQIEQVNGFETTFHRFVWSPDTLTLLTIFRTQIKLIDAYFLTTIWTKEVKEPNSPYMNSAYDGAFGLNGQQVVLAIDGDLVFVTTDTGVEIKRITCPITFENFDALDQIFVSYSPDGQSVAYGYTGHVRQFGTDAYTYIVNARETCDKKLLQRLDTPLYQLEFSPDGKYLMGDFSGLTFLWKTSDNQQYATFKSINSSFNGDSSLIATTNNGEIVLWNVDTLKPIGFYKSYGWTYALNPDGKILATTEYAETSNANGWSIKLWNTKTGEVLKVIKDLPGTPSELRFSPDGRLLAGLFDGEDISTPNNFMIWGVK